MFSCEYWEIFKNTYFEEHLRAAASVRFFYDMRLNNLKINSKKLRKQNAKVRK